MSYGIDIMFHKANNKMEAFELALEAMKLMKDNAHSIIENNIYYCPLTRMENKEEDNPAHLYGKYEESVRQSTRFWIRNLFTFRFMWWPQYNLLGMIGATELLEAKGWKNVYFQNSTDQDYQYSEWSNICEDFENWTIECQNIPNDIIVEKMDQTSREDYDTPELLAAHCDYARRSAMYKKVFDNLDIHSILYADGVSNKYEYFAMNAIPSSDSYLHLEIYTRAMVKKYNEE